MTFSTLNCPLGADLAILGIFLKLRKIISEQNFSKRYLQLSTTMQKFKFIAFMASEITRGWKNSTTPLQGIVFFTVLTYGLFLL